MKIEQTCQLTSGQDVLVVSKWAYSIHDGWELIEHWVPGRPHLSLEEREHLSEQLNPPEHTP